MEMTITAISTAVALPKDRETVIGIYNQPDGTRWLCIVRYNGLESGLDNVWEIPHGDGWLHYGAHAAGAPDYWIPQTIK